MPEPKLSVAEFSAKVKLKYPQYKDVDDSVLVSKMLDKYPVYSEQVDFDVKKKELSEASDLQSLAEPSASATSNKVPAAFGEIPKFEGSNQEDVSEVDTPNWYNVAKSALGQTYEIGKSALLKAASYASPLSTPLTREAIDVQAKSAIDKIRDEGPKFEQTFTESIAQGKFGDAALQAEEFLLGTAPLAITSAAITLGTGGLGAPVSLALMGGYGAQSAHLDAKGEKFYEDMSPLMRAGYTGAMGGLEVLGEGIGGKILSGAVKKLAAQQITKQAFEQTAKEIAKGALKSNGVAVTEEALAEFTTGFGQSAVDQYARTGDVNLGDAFRQGFEGAAMGAVGGAVFNTPSTIADATALANSVGRDMKNAKARTEINKYKEKLDASSTVEEQDYYSQKLAESIKTRTRNATDDAKFYEYVGTQNPQDLERFLEIDNEIKRYASMAKVIKDTEATKDIKAKVGGLIQQQKDLESKYSAYDTQEEAGIPSPVVEGQAPIEVQPIQVASGTSPEADRVLQVLEQQEVFQKIAEAQEVDNTEAQAAQQQILNAIDEVDALDIADDVKTAYIQTLEDKFDDIEYYDNKTITTTEQVTEEVPVGAPRAGSRTIVEPEVRRGKFRLFERLNNLEVAVGTETEGQTSVIETQEDGSIDVVTYDKATKQEVSRQPKVAENILGLEYVESILDADGNLTGVVMRPRTPKGEDISPVRIQVVNRPELALDIAIDARKKEIGDVPEVIWMQEYETVTRDVTTKERVPAAKRPERKAARVVLPTETVVAEQVTEQVVEQEPVKNNKGLSSEQVTEAVSAAERLARRLGLPTKIIVHNSRKEFNDAMDEVSKSGSVASGVESGRFIPSRNEIHLNLEDMTSEVPFHEVFHAAFVNRFAKASQATREKIASDFQSGLLRVLRSGTAEDQQLADAVERFVQGGEYSAKESPEEFMAQTAGIIAVNGRKISKSTMDKLIQWTNNFIGKVFPSLKITTRGEFVDFMNSFSGALFESSIDEQTYTGLESEVTTSIPPVSESSSRQGRDASYVDRKFDKEKIQFADLSEYVGKPAITYAMDLAVTGTVKSPTGVTYTFDGGVFYPLLGEGGWAFTDEKTAKKILSKLKKFDGRVLLMSQDSRGIRGNFQFWGYMLDEVNKAVKDKRATEAELVEYINSKLKKKPIQSALAEKGLPLQIKKLSELNELMPNDGPKKVGYEVRAEFNEALFSAEANKRFGLPRIEAILDYVNEPLLANAQYGDLVAVLEFDLAKMDVKDSRKIKGAKVHPAYPWIITGFKDLKILNEFVDVRNVFGDYRSKMAEDKGDPELKKRIKIRAARAIVTGGASVNNLEINDNIVKSILGIAPYRAKYVNEISEARDEYKKPSFERFINAFNNIAKKFDVQVYGIEKTIGGWYDSELNSVTQEVSMRPAIAGNKEDILAMSAVAGIMAPVKKEDFQNGVMIVEYKTGGQSQEVTFKAKSDADAKRIIDSLNDYGFGGGFTYVPSDKSFHLAMIPYDDVNISGLRNNLENLVTFAKSNNLIDEKSIQYYEAEVNFPGSDRESSAYYGRILQEARDSKRYEKDGREGALKLLNQALEILDERNNAMDSELSESSSSQANKVYDNILKESSSKSFQELSEASKAGLLIHATKGSFDTFDPQRIYGGARSLYGYGFYFTSRSSKALDYGNKFIFTPLNKYNFLDIDAKANNDFANELKSLAEARILKLQGLFKGIELIPKSLKTPLDNALKISSTISGDSKYGKYSIDDLRKFLDNDYILSFTDFSEAMLSVGYDGFQTDDFYEAVIFNFGKLNDNLIKDEANYLKESSSRDVREEILDKEQLSFKQRAVNTAKTFVWSDTQKQIRVFKERMSSQLSVEGREIKKFTKGLNQLLKKADVQTIDLVGNIFDGTLTPENQRILESKPNGSLIFGQANAMRNYIDSFADDFVNSPEFHAMPEETVNTIIDNFGQYMRGSYRFWKDKNFKPSNAARRDAIAYEYEILRSKKINDLIDKEGFKEDEAGEFFELLHDETLKEATKAIDDYIADIEKIRNGSDFKKLGIVSPSGIKLPSEQFLRRKELPETIQNLLGKERDPIIRFIDTTIALSNIKYKGHMLYAISESLGGTQFIKNEVTDAEKSTGEYKEVKDKFSPLNGRFVHRDVYEAITNQNIYESDNIWMSGYLTTLQLARKSKVIYNLPTWRKNLTGGWYTMAANGVINPSIVRDIKRRAQLFANGETDAETEALIKIMGDNGIIGQDVNANLLGFTNAIYSRTLTGNDNDYISYVDRARNLIKNFDSVVGQKYAAVDDYTKLVIFRSEIQSFAKKMYGKSYDSLTDAQKNKVHAEAAEFVKQNTPTFSRLPKWYASLAKLPAGDFLSFEFESLRSFSANIRNGQQDLMKGMTDKTLTPEQKAEYIKAGSRRLAGSAAIMGARLAITSILASLALGDDDELEEDIKNNRPNWMEGHSIIPTKVSKEGIATAYDYSMEDPYGSFFDLATDPLSFPAYVVDLLQPNMGISFLTNLAENKDFYGRDITNSYDSKLTKGYKYGGHTLKSLIIPPFIASSYRDEQKRLETEADKYSPLDAVGRVASRAVIRDYEFNIPVQFYYFTDQFRTKKEQYSDLTGASRDNRLAELDEIKKMYKSITNIGIKKGNYKMIADANKNVKRALKPNEEAYVLYGYEIPEKK
jgi:hypothetical protein